MRPESPHAPSVPALAALCGVRGLARVGEDAAVRERERARRRQHGLVEDATPQQLPDHLRGPLQDGSHQAQRCGRLLTSHGGGVLLPLRSPVVAAFLRCRAARRQGLREGGALRLPAVHATVVLRGRTVGGRGLGRRRRPPRLHRLGVILGRGGRSGRGGQGGGVLGSWGSGQTWTGLTRSEQGADPLNRLGLDLLHLDEPAPGGQLTHREVMGLHAGACQDGK